LVYLFNMIKFDLLWVLIIGILATIFLKYASDIIPEMPLNIPAFLGTAISILLSFKMAQSYDRWWEARKVWGAIVNDSRSLVLQLQHFCSDDSKDIVNKVAHDQIAWCYALTNKLRNLNNDKSTLKNISEESWLIVKDKSHKPLSILKEHLNEFKKLRKNNKIDGFAHLQLDDTVSRLNASMGMVERIKNTIFPTTYRYILHLSIYVFIIVLDISLKNIHFIYQFPLLIGIASIFFLLEKSASSLQDPFENKVTDTPMNTICETIEGNIKELIGEDYYKPALDGKLFYQM